MDPFSFFKNHPSGSFSTLASFFSLLGIFFSSFRQIRDNGGGGACTLKFPWIRDLLGVCLSCYQWKVKSGNNIIELNTTLFDWDCTVGQYVHCKHWHIMSQDCMWYSWIKHSELRSYFCCLSNFTCLFLQHASENSWIIHIIVLTQLQGLSFSVLAGTKYSFRGVGRLCWRMRL